MYRGKIITFSNGNSVTSVALKKVQEILIQQQLDFAIIVQAYSCPEVERSIFIKQCQDLTTPGFCLVPTWEIDQIDKGEAFGLPAESRFLIAASDEINLSTTYCELTKRIWNSQGFVFLDNPSLKWKNMLSSFFLINGFFIYGSLTKEQEEIFNYYLSNRFRISLLSGTRCSKDITIEDSMYLEVRTESKNPMAGEIIEGVKKGYTTITSSPKGKFSLSVAGHSSGQTVYIASGDEINIEICVSACSIDSVEVIKNSRTFYEESPQWPFFERRMVDKVYGQSYYYLKVKDKNGRISLTNPVYVKTTDWFWGDHHVHSGYPEPAESIGLDYVVCGLYGQVEHTFESTDKILRVPGGEIHGSAPKGQLPTPHIIVIQKDEEDHGYKWEPGIGYKETLEQVKRNRDLAFLAHPRMSLQHGTPAPWEEGFVAGFDGIEIMHGASALIGQVMDNIELRKRLLKSVGEDVFKTFDREELLTRKETERMWDQSLAMGMRCTGISGSDCHGLGLHGIFSSNQSLGLMPTVVHLNKQDTESLFNSLSKGDCWFTNGPFFYLDIFLDGKRMGEICSHKRQAVLKVMAGSAVPIIKIEVISDGKLIRQEPVEEECDLVNWATRLEINPNTRYFRVKVYDCQGHIAYSNPIYTREPKF